MAQAKTNTIVADHGDWLEVDISTPTHKNAIMKIDKVDYEFIRSAHKGRMHAYKALHQKYLYVNIKIRCVATRVHRLLLPDSVCVDHINHDGMDNRRVNIRSCTQRENNKNIGMRKDNTSGFVGVSFVKKIGKWNAALQVDKKYIGLGNFLIKQDAIDARIAGEKKYFGEYAPAR
jgi:hypothetical protein